MAKTFYILANSVDPEYAIRRGHIYSDREIALEGADREDYLHKVIIQTNEIVFGKATLGDVVDDS